MPTWQWILLAVTSPLWLVASWLVIAFVWGTLAPWVGLLLKVAWRWCGDVLAHLFSVPEWSEKTAQRLAERWGLD
jgi:hypothetical protein